MKKKPIIEGQEYILMEDFGDYKAGDYFVGEKGDWLRHVRTKQMLVAGDAVMKHFETTGRQFDYNKDAAINEEFSKKLKEMYQIQKEVELVMPSDKHIFDRIDRELKREQRQLIIKGVCLLLRFIIETAVLAAVIWLLYKQCKG